jgi:hypothetical protein
MPAWRRESDGKMDTEWSDWIPAGGVICDLQSSGDREQIKRALLDKLSSGSVRAVCAPSLHTYRTTTFPETGLAAIPAEEWRHYVASDSALERGVVRMQWTSKISLSGRWTLPDSGNLLGRATLLRGPGPGISGSALVSQKGIWLDATCHCEGCLFHCQSPEQRD